MNAAPTNLTNGHAQPLQAPRQILHHQASQRLELVWRDGASTVLDASNLRNCCLCSRCRAARLQRGPLMFEGVTLQSLTLFGVAGLQLHFSDGHDKGVFPWRYLYELGEGIAAEL